MTIKLGALEFRVEIVGQPEADIMNLTLRELQESDLILSPVEQEVDAEEAPKGSSKKLRATPPIKKRVINKYLAHHALLKTLGFSTHTIVMVAKKLFDAQVNGDTVAKKFPLLEEGGYKWMQRKLEDDIWALFVGHITVQRLGRRKVAVGLNKANQMVFLDMVDGNGPNLYERLIKRGLKESRIKFGLLSKDAKAEDFKEYFSNAKIGRDWNDFIEAADEDDKEAWREAMLNPDPSFTKAQLKKLKGPKELLTYYEFDKDLWRTFRTFSALARLQRDLRSRTRQPEVKTDEDLHLVVTWSIMRLQYQWYKTPVDAEHLSNLKFIRAQIEEYS